MESEGVDRPRGVASDNGGLHMVYEALQREQFACALFSASYGDHRRALWWLNKYSASRERCEIVLFHRCQTHQSW